MLIVLFYRFYWFYSTLILVLHTVTSIQTRKQDESCLKIQDPRQIKLSKKKVWEKRTKKKSVLRKKHLMHHLKVILIMLLKNISSEIIHADVLANAMNDEVSSVFSQICRTNWSYSWSSLIKSIYADWLSDEHETRRSKEPQFFWEKRTPWKKKMHSLLTNTGKHFTNWWIVLL